MSKVDWKTVKGNKVGFDDENKEIIAPAFYKDYKKKQGWFEQKQLVQTGEGIKEVAPVHREVAIKHSYGNTLKTPLLPESPKLLNTKDTYLVSGDDKMINKTNEQLNTRLDKLITKSGGLFGKDMRTEEEKEEVKLIVNELNRRKPINKISEDNGDIEFIMSSSGIEAAIRTQQPKKAYIAKWFQQTLSSDYTGNPNTGIYHICLVKKIGESEKAIQIETVVSDSFGKIIKTENKWYPKKAIENIEELR